ncbi:hypothetical protein [Candidatus Frankia alpina]|uniref:hypothetical protein n=1 Tax=Candidatus Frankia alpina TaxID=2699483 RepID=UPI0013D31C88|nr:hypothetical protein [Candidatus Frankia alpina]
MTLPGLLTDPPDDDPYLPVLNDLSVSGYCDFQGALSQARYMAAMNQHDAEDPDLPDDERQFAARTAIGQQATIQLFAALIGDRTELDALAALDQPFPA